MSLLTIFSARRGGQWRTTYAVSAVLLLVLALYEFVASTGAHDPTGGYNLSFVLGCAAVAAVFGAARGIPYTVRSGLRFFEQAHIKDVLAHLRIVVNPRDEATLGLRAAVGLPHR